MGGNDEDDPVLLSMVEGEGGVSRGGRGGGEFGWFGSIRICRDDIGMEGIGWILQKQGKAGK